LFVFSRLSNSRSRFDFLFCSYQHNTTQDNESLMFFMDSKRIIEKSEETLRSLTAVWDELGLEDAVRRQHLTELNKKLENVFEELLNKERSVRDQYKSNIERYKGKIQDICRILEEPYPNLDNMNTSGLMNTFVRLAEILETLHRVRVFSRVFFCCCCCCCVSWND
jgi:hypothetical protein